MLIKLNIYIVLFIHSGQLYYLNLKTAVSLTTYATCQFSAYRACVLTSTSTAAKFIVTEIVILLLLYFYYAITRCKTGVRARRVPNVYDKS